MIQETDICDDYEHEILTGIAYDALPKDYPAPHSLPELTFQSENTLRFDRVIGEHESDCVRGID